MGGSSERGAGEFLPLTHLTYQILVALADQDRHGYGIIKEIEATGGSGPSTGALYLALQRMEGEGLVGEAVTRPEGPDDDPRRKYYSLTPLGRRVASAESERMATLLGVAAAKRLVPEHGRG
jgi:DNA-binding PadR family transcriptional regulator